jgi:hypothetical protein
MHTSDPLSGEFNDEFIVAALLTCKRTGSILCYYHHGVLRCLRSVFGGLWGVLLRLSEDVRLRDVL